MSSGDTLLLNGDGNIMSILPLSVVSWKDAISYMYSDKVVVVKNYEDWEVHSPTVTLPVPSILMFKGYAWWDKTVVFTAENLFLRDNYTCMLQITSRCAAKKGKGHPVKRLTMDHCVPKSLGGKKSWTNIVTACFECNCKRGNNSSVKPKKQPHAPTYYDLLGKRKELPIIVKDTAWVDYLPSDWNKDAIFYKPRDGDMVLLKDHIQN